VSEALHPSAPHDLACFITAPGDTDTLMVVIGIILIAGVLMVGNLYLRLHTRGNRRGMAIKRPAFLSSPR
jgi:hypothetical protein